jgi:UDP-N-acetyl-D-mannosaminuronate dehydrogenase
VILHTNHEEYRNLRAEDLPGAKFIADGRNLVSEELKSRVKTYVLGQG